MYLDNSKYADTINLCHNSIHGTIIILTEYLVPAIAGTAKKSKLASLGT